MILNKIFFIALLGVVVPAHAQTVIVENDPCKYFNFTQADEGVPSVDYVPNVDAYGLAVVPADLAGSQPITLPETISFPLSVDLAERLQTNLPDGLELLPNLGEVSVDTKTGQAYFNGSEITSGLEKVCKDIALENDNKSLIKIDKNEIKKETLEEKLPNDQAE
ncbi:MAG: hypothetical protein CMH30_02945 [Micavibrio sp.]|nr:hypothetical protein [Micavibrio sp.]|tara:strand:- start:4348 stop:4839 length:492 start_codon:yes stop_codon:yes gene_type:complete